MYRNLGIASDPKHPPEIWPRAQLQSVTQMADGVMPGKRKGRGDRLMERTESEPGNLAPVPRVTPTLFWVKSWPC